MQKNVQKLSKCLFNILRLGPSSSEDDVWATLFSAIKCKTEYFLIYLSIQTFVLGAQKNCLIETVLLSTHNICFG